MTLRERHYIDSHKGATLLAMFGLLAWYGRWDSATAWTYLALHGGYGILWVWKSAVFPDKSWERECPLWYGATIWGGLTLYWLGGWLIMSRGLEAPAWWLGGCVLLYAAGVFLHFASDMQKHHHLAHRPGTLLQDGLWRRIRNPNYLGELMIYLGFGLLAQHWLPLAVIALFVVAVWAPNMLRKERSLARYPEFAAWKQRSWLILPGIL